MGTASTSYHPTPRPLVRAARLTQPATSPALPTTRAGSAVIRRFGASVAWVIVVESDGPGFDVAASGVVVDSRSDDPARLAVVEALVALDGRYPEKIELQVPDHR